VYATLAALWAALTFWLSASPDAQGAATFLDLTPPWDKLYHAGNFGVLAALLYPATGRVWLAVLLASLYGVSDEVHQAFVPGRSADASDWLADTVGALAAVTLLQLRQRRRAR
jgi:VanZ family protein